MSTYNGACYLRPQLDSIAAQTHPPDELIVCDDCSTDDSVEIVKTFAATAPFPVDVHVNNRNVGSTKNFERAIGLCSGDIIALCDQDDVWLPAKLGLLLAEFSPTPGVGLVFSDAEVVNEDLSPAGYSLWEKLKLEEPELKRLRDGRGFKSLLQGATVTGATAAFRSCFNPLILPIPDNIAMIHDAWIAVLIAAVSRVVPLPERLIKYRQHYSQQVGVVERKAPDSSSTASLRAVRGALQRQNPSAEMLAIGRAVQRRLMDVQQQFDSRRVLSGLEANIEHLAARSNLPRSRLKRAQVILRELRSGRYSLYSKGLFSAAKDLLT